MKKFITILVLLVLAAGVYVAWDYMQREAALREQVRKLEAIVGRLNAERRVAEVYVSAQRVDENGQLLNTVEFRELDRDNHPLPPITATLVGTDAYFEALVIKFGNEYVERGDALRGKSAILFTRMFGSATAPDSGVLIDPNASDGVPSVFRVDPKPSAFEKDLWARFWDYASHPAESEKLGVRVLQREAVSIRPLANMTYRLTVESDGGLSIVPITSAP